ncbi:hypothetical protein Scep_020999 [Stephania cephalantha]|uniref:Uncharacterized protein n=1 Tax=Stephania cephalantha TaxID=152367 RepID=A0AAP0F2K1_9MAGN
MAALVLTDLSGYADCLWADPSLYGDVEDIIKVPGSECRSIKFCITSHYVFHTDYMEVISGVLVGVTVLVAFGIKAFNFQQRW